MRSHPYPEGSLVMTYDKHTNKYRRHVQKHKPHNKVPGIVESYIRDYDPGDSYYLILIGGKIEYRDRCEVWFVS